MMSVGHVQAFNNFSANTPNQPGHFQISLGRTATESCDQMPSLALLIKQACQPVSPAMEGRQRFPLSFKVSAISVALE